MEADRTGKMEESCRSNEKNLNERAKELRWMVHRLMDRSEQRRKDRGLYELAAMRPGGQNGGTEDELARAFAESRGIVIDEDTDDDMDEDLENE